LHIHYSHHFPINKRCITLQVRQAVVNRIKLNRLRIYEVMRDYVTYNSSSSKKLT